MIVMSIETVVNSYEIKVEQRSMDEFNDALINGVDKWLTLSGWSMGVEEKVYHLMIKAESIEAIQWRKVK